MANTLINTPLWEYKQLFKHRALLFIVDIDMNIYKEIPSLVLIVLGLLAAWVALTVCQVGTGVQYFSAFLALGYWLLAFLSWPNKIK